jgi:hypothetical protein
MKTEHQKQGKINELKLYLAELVIRIEEGKYGSDKKKAMNIKKEDIKGQIKGIEWTMEE